MKLTIKENKLLIDFAHACDSCQYDNTDTCSCCLRGRLKYDQDYYTPHLKPCPFCGGDMYTYKEGDQYYMVCTDCDFVAPESFDDAETLCDWWNERPFKSTN